MKFKTAYLNIKLEPEIKREVVSSAKKERVHMSAWVRDAILLKLGRRLKAAIEKAEGI